jgi:hypothetical protein
MADLDKVARDALPEADFAVPGKRKLPIHDATHAKLAWDMVDRTSGLSGEERSTARQRIKARAQALGVDTSAWHITASFSFEAMALDMPDVEGHPNKMPFKGVLTRVDLPSDLPPGGAGGKRTMMPAAVAEAAIPSLMGMAVDFKPDFDGHDRQNKIGLITGAQVVGDAVEIEGFFYAKDFPQECKRIRAEKGALGFSFEADARIQDANADIWVIEHCVFTGAAVLYKDLAAYQTTSLAAKAEQDIEMTKEELQAILDAALKPITASIEKQGVELAVVQKAVIEAGKGASLAGPIIDQVKPHVDAINAAADAAEKAGVGTHSENGHVRHLRHVAAHMAAEAVSGRVPNVYRDHDFLPGARVEAGKDAAALAAAAADVAAKDKQIKDLTDSVASLGTKITDLSAAAFNGSPAPARATISPEIKTLMAKGGIKDDDVKEGKLSTSQVNAMLDAGGIKGSKAIEMKLKLRHDGLMEVGTA